MKTTTPITTVILLAPMLATAGTEPEPTLTAPPPASKWEFRVEPYAWLTAIDGSTGVRGYVADADASFSDILDVLEMAAALQFEARNGRWGFIGDFFYAELGEDATLPGPLATNINLDFTQFLMELEAFYRLSDRPESFVDLYAGLRYNSLELDMKARASLPRRDIERNGSGDQDWADPILGVRTQWNIDDHWFLAAKGDIGGFGISSDFTWNLQATVGYQFNDKYSAEVGYRYFDTDYQDGGFTYDVAQAGVILGFSIKF